MFQKILIANRGEIAVRIIRACREMGIRTVAVFSEADRAATHVRFADQAYAIGPAPSSESYLRIDRILEAARQSGAEAIHPGYGFLAENPAFAAACEEAGLTFIGPSARTLALCGSKTAARRLARQVGVPTVPGTDQDLSDEEETALSAQIGFPLLIKAAAGGGGKGMRIVREQGDLPSALRAARSEGQSSFGDQAVYLEKYLERPRHIEMQVLADGAGQPSTWASGNARSSGGTRRWWRRPPPPSWMRRFAGGSEKRPWPSPPRRATGTPGRWSSWWTGTSYPS